SLIQEEGGQPHDTGTLGQNVRGVMNFAAVFLNFRILPIAGSPGSGLKASPARYVAKRLYRCGSICKTEHLLMFNLRPLLTDQWSSTDQNLYQRLQMRCARRLGRGANLLPHVNQKIYRTDGQTDGLTY
ncbi:hypothetical protein J6590_092218, partial [Homalodisca vitripennis]